jgi:hypothetical protein
MQGDTPKLAVLTSLVLVASWCTALAKSEHRQQMMITKAPPLAQSKYITNSKLQGTTLHYRYSNLHTRSAPAYIAPASGTLR